MIYYQEEKNNILCCATLESFTISELASNKIGYCCATNDDYIYVNIKGSASSIDEFKASVNASPLVFYYKLDSEKIIIDGNEAVTKLKNDFVALPIFIKIPYADTSNEITITVPNGGGTRKLVYLFTTQGMYSMYYVSSRDEVQLITNDEDTTVSIRSGKLTITRNNILYYSSALAIVV